MIQVSSFFPNKICLAGHSLSTIALLNLETSMYTELFYIFTFYPDIYPLDSQECDGGAVHRQAIKQLSQPAPRRCQDIAVR